MLKSRFSILLIAMVAMLSFTVQSCNDDDDDDDTQPDPEFVADDNTFAGFMNWPLEGSEQGIDPALGAAHGGNDSTVTRDVYIKDGQNAVNGEYPIGTLIVKHTYDPTGAIEVYTAMAKRGNDFNTDGGDWEWFMINPDGSIADDNGETLRGADLLNGMCVGCHGAAATDFVFTD